MIIYDKNGIKRYDAPITEEASHIRELMKENYIQLVFNAPLIEFSTGDYIIHEQEKFTLQDLPKPGRAGSLWKYDIQFHSVEANWKNCVFFFIPETGAKESEWTLKSNPRTFLEMAVKNINRFMGTNITVADDIIVADTQSISFTNVSVWDGLAKIAEVFKTEWWFDGLNLHLSKCEYGSGVKFDLHKEVNKISGNKGSNLGYSTRIYPFGSTRNIIPETTSTATNSILNNRLKLAELEYIDSRDDLTKEEIVEAVVIFEDIYPRMKDKTISSVRFEEQNIEGKKQNVYFFKIGNLGFDPKPLIIEDMNLSVKFESGNLNGLEFELNWHADKQEFEILNKSESESLIIPNESLCPVAGDAVVLFNIKMPDSYKTEAQAELLTASQEYILESSKDRTVYSCENNPVYCSNNDIDLNIGHRVSLQIIDLSNAEENVLPIKYPAKLGGKISYRESRIQRFEKKLYNKYICTYQVGDNAAYSRIGNIERESREAKYALTSPVTSGGGKVQIITRFDNTKPTDFNVFSSLRSREDFAKRNEADTIKEQWKFNKGAKFGDDVVPGLSGGFVNDQAEAELKSLTLREFLNVPELRYNRVSVIAGEQWSAPGGGIIEEVDEIDSIVYLKLEKGEMPTVAAGDICKGIFNTGSGFQVCLFKVVELLSGISRAGFIYQLKPGTTVHPQAFMHFVAYGNFTQPSRQMSAVQTRSYTRFMAGVNNWDITSDMIKMHLGDMSGMTIGGMDFSGYSGLFRNIFFDGTLGQIAKKDIQDSIDNTLTDYVGNVFGPAIVNLQDQIDGVTTGWFYAYTPTLTDYPANMWNTSELKKAHEGDTFTNTTVYVDDTTTPNAGKSWRWADTSGDGDYNWIVISDSDATRALLLAGKAQDTADNKRQVFTSTPSSGSAYDVGDLWVNATYGVYKNELLRCITAKNTGASFDINHWTKATKYTDDSAVENLQIGGRNLLRYSGNFKDTSNITGAGFSSVDHFDGYIVCKTIASVGYEQWAYLKLKYPVQKLEKGTYTLSIRVRGSRSFVRLLEIATDGGQSAIAGRNINISTSWGVYSFQFNLTENYTAAIDHFARIICANDQNGDWRDNDWIDVAWFKLEKGSKATDWTAAQEDLDTAIEAASSVLYPREEYNNATVYVGNKWRRDVVWVANASMASGREYFTAKMVGEFSGIPTSNKAYWESRGANFEMVATNLLLSRKIKSEEIETDTINVQRVIAYDAAGNKMIAINENGDGAIQRFIGGLLAFEIIGDDEEGFRVNAYKNGVATWHIGSEGTMSKNTVDNWKELKLFKYTSNSDISNTNDLKGSPYMKFYSGNVSGNQNYSGLTSILHDGRKSPAYVIQNQMTIPDGTYTESGKPHIAIQAVDEVIPAGYSKYERFVYTYLGGFMTNTARMSFLVRDLIDY